VAEIKVEMASQAEAEESDAVVCVLLTDPLMLPDNEVGKCALCDSPIQYRPHVPAKPPKICVLCVEEFVEGEETTVIATPATVDDVNAYLKKRQQ
jgi:hypothetical protein